MAPAAAITPVTRVSVESCDAFLAAYAQCAASPSVPEAARAGIRQGINTMRESFRDSVTHNEAARPTVGLRPSQGRGVVLGQQVRRIPVGRDAARLRQLLGSPATTE